MNFILAVAKIDCQITSQMFPVYGIYNMPLFMCSMEVCEAAVVHWLKWLLEKLPEFSR